MSYDFDPDREVILTKARHEQLLREVDALRAAVRRVRELHSKKQERGRSWCEADGRTWPCPTIAALGEPPPADTCRHDGTNGTCAECRLAHFPSAGGSTPDPADTRKEAIPDEVIDDLRARLAAVCDRLEMFKRVGSMDAVTVVGLLNIARGDVAAGGSSTPCNDCHERWTSEVAAGAVTVRPADGGEQ